MTEIFYAQNEFQSREFILFIPFLLLNRMSLRTNLIIQWMSLNLKQELLNVIVYLRQHNKWMQRRISYYVEWK